MEKEDMKIVVEMEGVVEKEDCLIHSYVCFFLLLFLFFGFLTIIIVIVKEIITEPVLSTWWPFYQSYFLQTFEEIPGLCLQSRGNAALTDKEFNIFQVVWVYLERCVLAELFLGVL